MLVLSRKKNERIQIGDQITLTVLAVQGQQIKIGIEAPREVSILRGELAERPDPDQQPVPLAPTATFETVVTETTVVTEWDAWCGTTGFPS